jgi:hypothetical protein
MSVGVDTGRESEQISKISLSSSAGRIDEQAMK